MAGTWLLVRGEGSSELGVGVTRNESRRDGGCVGSSQQWASLRAVIARIFSLMDPELPHWGWRTKIAL